MKSLIFWGVLIAVALLMLGTMRSSGPQPQRVTYSQFLRDVEAGNVVDAKIRGGSNAAAVIVSMKDGSTARTVLPVNYREELTAMQTKGVNIEIQQNDSAGWPSILVNAAPFLVLLAVWIFLMRFLQSKGQRGPVIPVV